MTDLGLTYRFAPSERAGLPSPLPRAMLAFEPQALPP
jgi:hypothetical protein